MRGTSLLLLLALGCQPESPTRTPVGTWAADFWLDSAGPYGPSPTARFAAGTVTIGDSGRDSTFAWPDSNTFVPQWLGNYKVDFAPFFGTQVAQDVSTTFFGSTKGSFATELSAYVDTKDSLHLEMIPRISHGGIDAVGLLRGDSVWGTWYVRAYAGGATGHFRLRRQSAAAPPVYRDPPPPPLDTLPLARRGTILVRVLDTESGTYLKMRHGLHTDSSWIYSYATGTTTEGWGPSFWLQPGSYGVVINEIPCGDDTHFLDKDIEKRFRAVAGETTFVTVRLALGRLILGPSFKNATRQPCATRRSASSGG